MGPVVDQDGDRDLSELVAGVREHLGDEQRAEFADREDLTVRRLLLQRAPMPSAVLQVFLVEGVVGVEALERRRRGLLGRSGRRAGRRPGGGILCDRGAGGGWPGWGWPGWLGWGGLGAV